MYHFVEQIKNTVNNLPITKYMILQQTIFAIWGDKKNQMNGMKHLLSDWSLGIYHWGEDKSVMRNCGQVRRCNLKIRFWAGVQLEENGGVSQLLPYASVWQAVDGSRAGWARMESRSSHGCGGHSIKWCLNAVQITSVICAGSCHGQWHSPTQPPLLCSTSSLLRALPVFHNVNNANVRE